MKLTLNRQNMRYWNEANPKDVHVEPLHSRRVTAWSGISASGITGPYFCEDKTGSAVILTSDRYAHSANELFFPELRRRDMDLATNTKEQRSMGTLRTV
jgi:hypothetical protein